MRDLDSFLLKIDKAAYHSDAGDHPTLSVSTAGNLINRSPYHTWLEHPKLGGKVVQPTKAMIQGNAVHSLIFGEEIEYDVLDFPDYRTNAARYSRDAAIAEGKTPILKKELEAYEAKSKEIRFSLESAGIVFKGLCERSIYWSDKADNGNEVKCRSKLDHVDQAEGLILIDDIKTCGDANPKQCIKTITNFDYDMQAFAYVEAIEQVAPEWAGRVHFRFIFIEAEPPYIVTPVRLDGAFMSLGESKWRRAVNLWEKCLRENCWPTYTKETLTVTPEAWAMAREEAENLMEAML